MDILPLNINGIGGGLAVDKSGNIYFSDTANLRIRKVIADTGVIITVAGNGDQGTASDGALATNEPLDIPAGIALDANQNLYFTEVNSGRIREVRRFNRHN
ncbi:MAG TPA: hypothetical protein VKX17_12365 [Planctomycetota bacterium]|nr:hypothetical protein [Planctomycetota bacterium]